MNGREGLLFGLNYAAYSLKGSTPAVFFSRHGWSKSSAVRLEVDEGITRLGQLRDGDSSSLFDVLSHGSHLLRSDVDELPSVINHTYREERKDLEVSTLAPLTSRHTSVTSFGRAVQTAEAAFHI